MSFIPSSRLSSSRWLLLRALLGTALAGAASAQYLDFAALEKQLTSLAAQYPSVVTLETFGRSAGGRNLYALQIAAPGTTPPSERPALFVGANIVGYHNAGTQAALALIEKLAAQKPADRTYYIAPALNPDAHDSMFAPVRFRNSLNGGSLDRDRDGLVGEDPPDDLNGDGRITQLRIPDPNGGYLPDPADPRVMKPVDSTKGEKGAFRLLTEGWDNDEDGEFNEDPPGGLRPDRNFAHAWDETDPESGPFPSAAPEARAIMDYLLARRNIAAAILFGPANNLLELPRGAGGQAGDVGQFRVRPPARFAQPLGLDPEREYTVDEIYELVKDSPLARQAGAQFDKDALAQFLGAGPALAPAPEDLRYYTTLADSYKKILEKAGLDNKRSGRQSQPGGLQNWLYYHYGTLAVELDVWGIPKKPGAPSSAASAPTLNADTLEKMSSEDFLALGEEKLAAFLKEIKAPAMITPSMLLEGVKSGRLTPPRIATMMRQQGLGAPPSANSGSLTGEQADLMDYIDKQAPQAFVSWTPVTLPDGTKAEVGGVDPFVEIAPPEAELKKAVTAHLEFIEELAGKLARLDVLSAEAKRLSDGVYRVEATAGNTGFLPTHTSHGARARTFLPVRLQLQLPPGATLLSGAKQFRAERLTGGTGTLKGEWILRAPPGAKITVTALSQNSGAPRREVVLP